MSSLKSWFQDNSTLVMFLFAQALAIGAAVMSITVYMVQLETRVSTMETRGAAYTADRLNRIDERLTVLEQNGTRNAARLERIVDVMTRELGKNPVK